MADESYQNDATESTPILPPEDKPVRFSIPKRYAMAILGFFGFFNVYAMRVNLSVALVAMVNETKSASADGSYPETACINLLPQSQNQTSQIMHQGEFNWDSGTQSIILGAFFYGYVVTQIPGGLIAERFGAKWLFGIGVLVTSVLTIITPFAARLSVTAFVIVRVVEGLAEGVTFPAMNAMIGRWVPKMERSRISTLVFTGSPAGTVVAMAVSGLLSGSGFLGGWPSVFYVFGLLGCIWFVFWAFLTYENPEDHPKITTTELHLIQENKNQHGRLKVPWLSVLTSFRVWALAITHFGQNWGFYTLLTEMPTYMANILHFDIKQNGGLSSLPYIMQAFFAALASIIADKLRQKSTLSITTIRKIINSIAFFGPGICVLLVAFVGCKPIVILILLCAAMGFNGFMYSGFNVTHVDMSPELAGTLMGITNCVSNFSGFLAPYVVGKIIADGQTLQHWGLVFGITSAMYFFTGTVYDLFCSAELQPWGFSQESKPSKPSLTVDFENKKPPSTTTINVSYGTK